jgi:RNA polymerase sigma-70 factor (ECF subfamily)
LSYPSQKVTRLLHAAAAGEDGAVGQVLPLVYDELRRIAQRQMADERSGHTLQATALVHEAFLKLVDQRGAGWRSRSDFFGIASKAMRRILVDHARARHADKRGGSAQRMPLDEHLAWFEERTIDLLELDSALNSLARVDETKAKLVELRFFAGLGMEQTAEFLGMTKRTAEREWTLAKSWLREQMPLAQERPPDDRRPGGAHG